RRNISSVGSAPRHLKAPSSWRSSRFRRTRLGPQSAAGAASSSVVRLTSADESRSASRDVVNVVGPRGDPPAKSAYGRPGGEKDQESGERRDERPGDHGVPADRPERDRRRDRVGLRGVHELIQRERQARSPEDPFPQAYEREDQQDLEEIR